MIPNCVQKFIASSQSLSMICFFSLSCYSQNLITYLAEVKRKWDVIACNTFITEFEMDVKPFLWVFFLCFIPVRNVHKNSPENWSKDAIKENILVSNILLKKFWVPKYHKFPVVLELSTVIAVMKMCILLELNTAYSHKNSD